MIMNYYRRIDRTKVQFDFLVHRKEVGFYEKEIIAMGGRIYRVIPIRPWSYLRYFSCLDHFFADHHDYVAVHSHIQENSGHVFKYAHKYGIKNLIAHSHIADLGIDIKFLFRQYGKYYVHKYATENLACGVDAGKFLYGTRSYKLLNNAIDAEKFVFNAEVRDMVRKELGVEGKFVVGSVARFCPQKNHIRMLEIFAELKRLRNDSVLVLVGTGNEQNKIEAKIAQLNLVPSVKLLGNRSDINKVLQAFDVFFMPSLFEGLPVSVIEAQASGLPCVLSDTVDPRVDISGIVSFVSLNEGNDIWAKVMCEKSGALRKNMYKNIVGAGYDVMGNVQFLLDRYLQF